MPRDRSENGWQFLSLCSNFVVTSNLPYVFLWAVAFAERCCCIINAALHSNFMLCCKCIMWCFCLNLSIATQTAQLVFFFLIKKIYIFFLFFQKITKGSCLIFHSIIPIHPLGWRKASYGCPGNSSHGPKSDAIWYGSCGWLSWSCLNGGQ